MLSFILGLLSSFAAFGVAVWVGYRRGHVAGYWTGVKNGLAAAAAGRRAEAERVDAADCLAMAADQTLDWLRRCFGEDAGKYRDLKECMAVLESGANAVRRRLPADKEADP